MTLQINLVSAHSMNWIGSIFSNFRKSYSTWICLDVASGLLLALFHQCAVKERLHVMLECTIAALLMNMTKME
jgi:hypothetical protein